MKLRITDITAVFDKTLSVALSVALFAIAVLFQGCDSGIEPEPGKNSMLQVEFTITLSDNYGRPETRASYETGSGYENHIGFESNDVSFLLFDGNGKFIEKMAVIRRPDSSDTEKTVICGITMQPTRTFKVVALVNWGPGNYPELTPGVSTIEDMCTAYTYNYTRFKPYETAIPMWGILTSSKEIKEGETNDIGELNLLRAMAKIEVMCKEGSSLQLKDVNISLHNNSGYYLPAFDDISDVTGYVTHPNIPAGVEQGGILPFKIADNNVAEIYIPEFKNIGVENPCRIGVTFGHAPTEVHYIEFCEYQDGKPQDTRYDIHRNTLYRFIVSVTPECDFEVEVIPFTGVELKPEYGMTREDFTGYIIGKDKEGNDCWYSGGTPYYLGPDDDKGNFVTINGIEYLLVYNANERTADTLDHFYEKETHKKYMLDPVSITGYTLTKDMDGSDMYLNKLKQPVWLDSDWYIKCCRTLNEWDRNDWNRSRWDHLPEYHPKYWFDVLGNRYTWEQGDTEAKRKDILNEWVKYLQ